MLSTVVSYITDADNSTGILLVLLLLFIYAYGAVMDYVRSTENEDEFD